MKIWRVCNSNLKTNNPGHISVAWFMAQLHLRVIKFHMLTGHVTELLATFKLVVVLCTWVPLKLDYFILYLEVPPSRVL